MFILHIHIKRPAHLNVRLSYSYRMAKLTAVGPWVGDFVSTSSELLLDDDDDDNDDGFHFLGLFLPPPLQGAMAIARMSKGIKRMRIMIG